MKILLGVPEYPPYTVGGGGEVYKNLAYQYNKAGHEVVVFYGYYPTKSFFESIEVSVNAGGVKFYKIPEIPCPKKFPFLRTALPPLPGSWLKLKKLIKKEDFDVAHFHGYGYSLVTILSKIAKSLGIPYVFTLHGYTESQKKQVWLVQKIWSFYEQKALQKVLKNAYKLTSVSDFIKKDARNFRPEDTEVIFNGIDTVLLDLPKQKNLDIRKEHNVDPKTKIIFSLGRIEETKGFQLVVEGILPKFLEKGTDVVYFIAGRDMGYQENLEELMKSLDLQDKVKFIGFVEPSIRDDYIRQCDYFAIPSLREPFGLVALEGMVQGKPIIYNDEGALSEVLKEYPLKIKLEDFDPQRDFFTEESFSSRSILEESFNWNRIADQYLDILKEAYEEKAK